MEGVQLRPLAADRIDEVLDLQRRSDSHDGVVEVVSAEEIAEWMVDGGDSASFTRGAYLDDGRLIGYVRTEYLPSETKEERCYLDGVVDPDHRKQGVGTTLVQWGVERATEQLLSSGRELPRYVRIGHYENVESAHELFAALGFEPVRHVDEMLRPLADLPPVATVDGIDIVDWPTERGEEIRQVKNAAFADHWGSTPTSVSAWETRMLGFGARPDLSFVALDGDRIVGHCLNARYPADDANSGHREAWIDSLGTLAEYRGRGIASAMIIRSLHAFAAEDLTHAILGVDSASLTGAIRLYASLGFETVRRNITHQIQV